MKKTFLTIVLLSIIGLIYYGLSFYTSLIAKEKLNSLIEQANTYFAEHPTLLNHDNLTISHKVIENRFFSSQHRIILTLSPKNPDQGNDKQKKTQINFELLIENGFFPKSNILNGNFSPVLTKYIFTIPSSVLDRNILSRKDVDKNAPLATLSLEQKINNNTHISAILSPFDYPHPNHPIHFDGGEFNSLLNVDNQIVEFIVNIGHSDVKFNSPWIPGGHIIDEIVQQSMSTPRHQFKFDSFVMSYFANPNDPRFSLGHKQIDLSGFKFNIAQYPILEFASSKFIQQQIQRDNITEIENQIELDQLSIYGLPLGSGETTFISLHRNFNDVSHFYGMIARFINSQDFKRTEIDPTPSIETFLENIEAIITNLESNPGYQLNPFVWRNEMGEISIKSEIVFSNNLTYNLSKANHETPYQHINIFHVDITTKPGVIPQLMTHLDQIMGIEASAAADKNQRLIEDNLALLTSAGIILMDKDNIRFTFSYANNNYVLNGIPYTRTLFLEFISLVSLRQNGLLSPENLIKLNQYISNQNRSN